MFTASFLRSAFSCRGLWILNSVSKYKYVLAAVHLFPVHQRLLLIKENNLSGDSIDVLALVTK